MKKYALVLASVLMVSSGAFAGLKIVSHVPTISGKTTFVQCNGGLKIPALVDVNVPWRVVYTAFMGLKHEGMCTFTFKQTGDFIGSGNLVIADDFSSGNVSNVKTASAYKLTVTGNQTDDVVLTIDPAA